MTDAVFVTDLHGKTERYLKLFEYLRSCPPDILFIGGDLLPPFMPSGDSLRPGETDFIHKFLMKNFLSLRNELGKDYPQIFLIMGNDDPRYFESSLISASVNNLWTYLNKRKSEWKNYVLFGYNFVPPTPFMLKDWEKYDVSRYTDIGCISPEEGRRTFPVSEHEIKWTTIKEDLDVLTSGFDPERSIFLFHAPPYNTSLDIGDIRDKIIDYVPIDEHLGSIAIERFIKETQPALCFHGHIHESARISGNWIEIIGKTVCINGAHDGRELAVIRLQLEQPGAAVRFLL